MIRFPVPKRSLGMPATKPAHLLRLTRYLQPYPRFMKTAGSLPAVLFSRCSLWLGSGLNVVDGPILWRAGRVDALTRRK